MEEAIGIRAEVTSPLQRVDDVVYDVVIAGGGITGACVALQASRAGLRVALVEREDFGAGATAHCLRILHGGLRYLQHLDVRRMRESIGARSAWLEAAPHLVEPLPVVLPTFRGRFPPRWLLAGALAANEVASADRNRGLLPGRRIPRARVLSRAGVLRAVPQLDVPGLTGGVLFHDAIMYSAERLALEVIEAARQAGATVLNHVEFTGAVTAGGRVVAARVRDRLTADEAELRARWIVNATGAWAGEAAARILGRPATGAQRYSVALNFVTTRPAGDVAFAVSAGAPDPDRVVRSGARQLFVVPWREQAVVGTAHLPWHGDAASFELRDEHVAAFLAEIATATPQLGISADDVAVVQRGLLPVAEPGTAAAAVRLLKRHRVLDHAADGVAGALSVVTVKYTTAPVVAAEIVARLTGGRVKQALTAAAMPGAAFASLPALRTAARDRAPGLPADVVEHLVRSYGARHADVLELGRRFDDWDSRVVPGLPVIRAQLLYGAAAEHARTAEDLLYRRTEIGARGPASDQAVAAAGRALADARGSATHRRPA
jgi:glycerol-3-phosphate dehydrogenase